MMISICALALQLALGPVVPVDLPELIRDINTDLRSGHERGVLLERIGIWTPQLEAAIEVAVDQGAADMARLQLASMYMTVGRPSDAGQVLDQVIQLGTEPSSVLQAYLDAARAEVLGDGDRLKFLEYTEAFSERVAFYRAQGTLYPTVFDERLQEIELVEARYLSDCASWMLRSSSATDKAIAGSALELAAERVRAHGERRGALGLEEQADLLWRRGEFGAKAAGIYDEVGDTRAAEHVREVAVETLLELNVSFGNSSHGQRGAALLLRERYLLGIDLDEYAAFAEEAASHIGPGHEVIGFLKNEALNLSRDPATLVAANRLFQLVLSLERKWFPREHRDHVNYQWALLGSARNAFDLGDVLAAKEAMEELSALNLRGDYFAEKYGALEEVAMAYGGPMGSLVEPKMTDVVIDDQPIMLPEQDRRVAPEAASDAVQSQIRDGAMAGAKPATGSVPARSDWRLLAGGLAVLLAATLLWRRYGASSSGS